MYKVIAFDAYGTLFDVYSMSQLAEEFYPGHGQNFSIMWRDRQIEYTRLISMADPSDKGSKHYMPFWDVTKKSLQYTCERLNLPLSGEQETKFMAQYAKLTSFQDSEPVLKTIKEKSFQTAILSNGSQQMLTDVAVANGLTEYLDALISVDEVHQFKVMPQVYDLLLKKFACKKEEVLFVSCNAWDVVGAGWFGFDTYWVNRQQLPFEKIGQSPTLTGPDLTTLLQYL